MLLFWTQPALRIQVVAVCRDTGFGTYAVKLLTICVLARRPCNTDTPNDGSFVNDPEPSRECSLPNFVKHSTQCGLMFIFDLNHRGRFAA